MKAEAIVIIPKSANKCTEIQMDVLPLVLCRDCIHYDKAKKWCQHMMVANGGAWFCADGERKELEGEA